MTNFYVYCETHGVVSPGFLTREEAIESLKEYLRNGNRNHGKVYVIAEKSQMKYGKMETKFVQVYARIK